MVESADLRVALRWTGTLAIVPVADRGRSGDRTAGGRAAVAALRLAGCRVEAPPGHAPDGRPLWPTGYAGSISHAGGWALAAVARATLHRAVGVDIEREWTLPAADARYVLNDGERPTSGRVEKDGVLADATLAWSAKEAAFKCWSHATEGAIGEVDPLDIEVHIRADSSASPPVVGSFEARASGALASVSSVDPVVCGRWASIGGVLATICTVAGPDGRDAALS